MKLSGFVHPNGGETRYTFEYGPTTTYGTRSFELKVPAGDQSVPVEAVIRDGTLIPLHEYDFRIIAENSVGKVESPNLTFIAPKIEEPPLAIANPPIQTSSTAATLQGAVDPGGLSTTYHFEFGKTRAYGTDLPETEVTIPAGDGLVPIEASTTVLEPNTTYFYRLVAKNAKGESKSLVEVFTTPPERPLATATSYAQTGRGHVLYGTVDPNGQKTTYYFEFGVPQAGGLRSSEGQSAGTGTTSVSVSQSIGPLPPDSDFQFRLVAISAGGESKSKVVSFTTPREPEAGIPLAKKLGVQSISVRGTRASIELSAPDLGLIRVSGKDLSEVSKVSFAAGSVKLSLSLTPAGVRRLKGGRLHELKLPAQITFLPFQSDGGRLQKTSAKLVFEKGGT